MLISLNRYKDRLPHLTWDEFRVRGCQEFAKRWDALFFSRLQRAVEYEAENSGNFFFSAEQLDPIVAYLQQHMPEAIEVTIAQAERICRHEFDLLGYEGLRYGPEIDWHLDAVSGKSAPRELWFKIRYLEYSEVGDAKVTWELNRHQHLVTLAKAYCFTRDDRYALELIRQWYHWQRSNPYPIGVNWASSLEVAFRSFSWLWVFHLLQKCPLATSQFKADLQRGLLLNGRHIEKYLSTYFSPNTHLLGEGVALFFLGVMYGSGPASARWKEVGWDIVLAQAERQVQADGMHFEQSTYYHVYALDLFLHARILAGTNGTSIPSKLDRVLERMMEALCNLGCGSAPPRLGDDDGGRLFDPRRNRAEHLLDPLSTGAVLFSRSDFRAIKPDLVEETVWLLGPEQARKFDSLPYSLPELKSTILPSSGLYVMVFPGQSNARLLVDAGAQGADGGGHGHADALSVQLAINGRDVLVDPGTFAYVSAGPERQMFRGTSAHNTVQVDGVDQAEPAGPFRWRHIPKVCVEKWVPGNSFELLVASHNGYARLGDPVIHHRYFFSLKGKFWLVLDSFEGKGTHRADISWHLAPDLSWKLLDGSALGLDDAKGGVTLIFAESQTWSPRILQGWSSPVYGRRQPTEVLTFSYEGNLSECFATILLPRSDSVQSLGHLKRMKQELLDYGLRVYRYDHFSGSDFVFFGAREPWRWRELTSDAEFLYYSISECGNKRLILCGAKYAAVGGESVISCSRDINWLELSIEDGNVSLASSEESAVCSSSWQSLGSLERWAAAEVSTV